MQRLEKITSDASRFGGFLVKVCGMRSVGNIAQVASLAPDLMGFIFYPRSPRYAGALPAEALKTLPATISPVGVFVNSPTDRILSVCSRYGIGIAQLHGNESPEQCRQLKNDGLKVFKAVGVDQDTSWEELRPYCEAADMFLLDTKTPKYGGSGKKFNWEKLEDYPLEVPYLLSGGISSEDLGEILASHRAMMAGIDLNSRFETAPGVKDVTKLREFITTLRKEINERR